MHLRQKDQTRGVRLWCNAGLLAVVAVIAGSYAEAGPDNRWHKACREMTSERICVLSQRLRDSDDRAVATLRLQPQGESGLMQWMLPMGVHLGSGVVYALDGGKEHALRYQRCQDGRCEASAVIGLPQWQALLKARDIDLIYRPDAGSPPRRLRLALQGLAAALQDLNNEAAQ